MLKRLKNSDKIRIYSDLPKVEPGEIFVAPLIDDCLEFPPVVNETTWPDWFKDPRIAEPGTIASCKGIQDLLSTGITFHLWCDYKFIWESSQQSFIAKASDQRFWAESFPYSNTVGCPIAKARPASEANWPKLVNPWYVKTAKGYSSLLIPTLYDADSRYHALPGVVHTDYYHAVNAVLQINTDEEFVIKAGTPLFQLIPFKRKDNIKTMTLGTHEAATKMRGQGVSHGNINVFSRKGLYRKHQRKADADS